MSKLLNGKHACINPKCLSSDAMRMYEDETGFCFSCSEFFSKEQLAKAAGNNDAEIEEEFEKMDTPTKRLKVPDAPKSKYTKITVEDVSRFPIRGFKDRGIMKNIAEFFNVRVTYDEDGSIEAHYYPYASGTAWKIRKLPKDFTWINKSADLFGKEKFTGGGRRLVICEGEIDCMTMAQASFEKYGKVYPVVSLSSSVMTKSILENRDWVRSFQEVILMFDHDDAGDKATAEAIKIIGADKVKIAKLPCNDVNETYVQHGGPALMNCMFDAAAYIPPGIIGKEAIWEALVNYNSAVATPYPPCLEGVNTKLKGMREGEITLFISGTGCFGKGTEILMFDGSLKNVEDVVVGDAVMGDDNTLRRVQSLYRGREDMVDITLRDGTSFVCNESHVLSVVNNDNEGRWGLVKDEVVDVKVVDYVQWSAKRKHLSKAFKAGRLDFEQSSPLPVPPYVLGAWLGDGYSDGARFACHEDDVAIIQKIRAAGYDVYKGKAAFMWNAPGRLQAELKGLGVLANKHIPDSYLIASSEDRLEFLAGLLDTDGSYDSVRHTYEFSQKSEVFTRRVKRLAESLGFTTTLGKQVNNRFGNCWRLYISGEGLQDIPCALPRKQARLRNQAKNPYRYSFKVNSRGEDDFYGFEVDGNHRFVLGNFVVTHNSGKSTLLRETIMHLLETEPNSKVGIVSLEESPQETARKLAGMAINRNPAYEEIPIEDLKVGFDAVFGSDRVVLLDHQGSINDSRIIDQLEYMCLVGCTHLFVDHITILVSEGVENLTGNEAQDKVMNDLLRIVKRYPVWIGLVSHLRKAPGGGKAFEEGKLPSIDDIRGSGSVKQISFDIIAFARNLTATDENERNTILMRVLKSRYTGLTGTVNGARYIYETGRLVSAITGGDDDDFVAL